MRGILRLLWFLCLKAEVRGLENLPESGPALLVTNHLGDADTPLLVTTLPVELDAIGKIEMYDFPVIGKLMHWYGVIWVHRGRADIRAMRAALQGLAEGRKIIIAPEGRYSLIQGLEQGTDGAAFLARKAGVKVVPIALTGTENRKVYSHLKRLRRAPVTLTIGEPYLLDHKGDGHPGRSRAAQADTQQIMESLASLLPPEYQGVYRNTGEI
jgi:1-acyl-sn-glycerol-3-phosphate acyltransferase